MCFVLYTYQCLLKKINHAYFNDLCLLNFKEDFRQKLTKYFHLIEKNVKPARLLVIFFKI